MSKSGIVNVRMVITEEKIISNIDKIQKMINPNNKKQIVELEEDTYFKDLIESIKTYLVEYPNKKNFPVSVYNSAYGLVEFAINQFEENTKKVKELIRQREENIALAGELSEVVQAVEEKQDGWKKQIDKCENKFSVDIIEALNTLGRCKTDTSQKYTDTMKILQAKINNLESNLHIEIDMERLEDSSKALSFIGIEISDALKLIPTPEEDSTIQNVQEAVEEKPSKLKVRRKEKAKKEEKVKANVELAEEQKEDVVEPVNQVVENVEEINDYEEKTTFNVKPSLWQRFKKSKFVWAATYIFRIRVKIELPTYAALPEGRGEN